MTEQTATKEIHNPLELTEGFAVIFNTTPRSIIACRNAEDAAACCAHWQRRCPEARGTIVHFWKNNPLEAL